MSCNDGEEQRLEELLSYVETHVTLLTEEFGQVGEARLMLMASLMIADELWDLRDELEENAERAQEELRELAGINPTSEPAPSKAKSRVEDDIDEDDPADDEFYNEDDLKDANAALTGDMDIGIDQTHPISKKRAYR